MAPSLAVRSLAIFLVFPHFVLFVEKKTSRSKPGLSGLSEPSPPRAREARHHASWFSRAATSEAAAAAGPAESIDFIAVYRRVRVPCPLSARPWSPRSILSLRTKLNKIMGNHFSTLKLVVHCCVRSALNDAPVPASMGAARNLRCSENTERLQPVLI